MTDGTSAPAYRCGNLAYTRRGLVALFAWLLWGDFCFTLMEAVVPSVLPLKLRGLESANWLIALVMTTLPGVFNTTVCPWVSFRSDRHRGRLGRRIPFILATLPFLTASLVLLAFGDEIGRWLHATCLSHGAVRRASVIVLLLAVFAACFDLFNMFVNSVYWYLFNDVVPPAFLGRFMGWFRAVGTLSNALYHYFILQYAQTHMRAIFLGAAALYFVGFGIMCLRVRERDYPPPDDAGLAPSLPRFVRTLARECYGNRFYWDIFLATMFTAIGGTIGTFTMFFQFSLGLDLRVIGRLGAVGLLASAAAMLGAGVLVDRWHPVRTAAYGTAVGAFLAFNNWIWLLTEIPGPWYYFWVVVAVLPCTALHGALVTTAALPREMMLFPRDRLGQFCGAQSVVRSGGVMIGGFLAGVFIDLMRQVFPDGDFAYRFNFVWSGCFLLVAFGFHYRAYRAWKRLGAAEGYRPPAGKCRLEDLPPRRDTAGVRPGLAAVCSLAFVGAAAAAAVYGLHYWRAGNLPFARLFGLQVGLQAALCTGYFAFLRFMERP